LANYFPELHALFRPPFLIKRREQAALSGIDHTFEMGIDDLF